MLGKGASELPVVSEKCPIASIPGTASIMHTLMTDDSLMTAKVMQTVCKQYSSMQTLLVCGAEVQGGTVNAYIWVFLFDVLRRAALIWLHVPGTFG